MTEEEGFAKSSGNVFADIGVDEPDKMLLKVDFANNISRVIDDRGWTQGQAAMMLGIDQPKVSALVRGRLSGFSTDRLLRFIDALGYDVPIGVSPKPAARAHAQTESITAIGNSSRTPETVSVS